MSAPLSICPGLIEQRISYALGGLYDLRVFGDGVEEEIDWSMRFNLVRGNDTLDDYELAETPVTNRQWRAYFARYHTSPYILMAAIPRSDKSGELDFCIVRRSLRVENLLGAGLAQALGEDWNDGRTPALFSLPAAEGLWSLFGNVPRQERMDVGRLEGIRRIPNNERDPLVNGGLIVFKLHKSSPWPRFNGPEQPIVGLSYFHMKAFCMDLGLELPTDEQWTWAAIGGEANLEYPTVNNQLVDSQGRPLAHWNQNTETGSTCSVYDERYPPGPFGLRQMAGNVWERTERNLRESCPYALFGGSWDDVNPEDFRGRFRFTDFSDPDFWGDFISFRPSRRRGL